MLENAVLWNGLLYYNDAPIFMLQTKLAGEWNSCKFQLLCLFPSDS